MGLVGVPGLGEGDRVCGCGRRAWEGVRVGRWGGWHMMRGVSTFAVVWLSTYLARSGWWSAPSFVEVSACLAPILCFYPEARPVVSLPEVGSVFPGPIRALMFFPIPSGLFREPVSVAFPVAPSTVEAPAGVAPVFVSVPAFLAVPVSTSAASAHVGVIVGFALAFLIERWCSW